MSSPIAQSALEQVVMLFDSPVFILDTRHRLVFHNGHAGHLVASASMLRIGAPLEELIRIEKRVLHDVLQARPNAEEATWRERIISVDDQGQHLVKLRARPITTDRKDEQLFLLIFEETGSWEERYRHVLEGAPVIFLETARDGKILYGGRDLSRILEYTSGNLPNNNLFKLVADEGELGLLRGVWTEVLSTAGGKGCEVTLDGAGGISKTFWASLFPVFSGAGEVVGVRGTLRDMGTQKDLANALESAEERFKVLFTESSDPIMILTVKGEILSVNPAFEQITGVQSEDLFMGDKEWKDFVFPEDAPRIADALNNYAQSEESRMVELRFLDQKKASTWFEVRFSILFDEASQPKGLMAVARNIEKRKQAERLLREQAEAMERRHQRAQSLVSKLKSFFTHMSLLPSDLDGFLNGVCEILFEMYAPLRVEILLQPSSGKTYQAGMRLPASLLDAAGVPVSSAMADAVMQTSFPVYSNNLGGTDAYAPDNWVRTLSLNTFLGAPLRDSTGRIWGVLSILDTTARDFDNQDVELVTVAALHLAARLRAEEQEKVKHELEDHLRQAQKMDAVGKLAGGIAHDFNNILSGILGFSSLLLAKAEKGTRTYENLKLIEQSAVRASELTRQLLSFSSRKHFTRKQVDINKVIEEVLTLARPSLPKSIVVQSELAQNMQPFLGDSGQLNQVFMNLCLNAGDAMAEKGGVLKLKTACRPLTARERGSFQDARSGNYVCVTVSDTGIGMSAEIQKRIFDPFFTTKRDKGGNGLGLSIVYGIVTNHEGFINLESSEGVGTVFKVYFPVTADVGVSVEEISVPAPVTLEGHETVLVVDDEPVVRQVAASVLEGYGYKVRAAVSGMEADRLMVEEGFRPDIVLLDMIMPEMDGVATFHAIRRTDKKVPILLTSGFSEEERSGQLLKLGAKGMLHKPYKGEELARRIRLVLNEAKAASVLAVNTANFPPAPSAS